MVIRRRIKLALQALNGARTGDGLRERAMRASVWAVGGNLASVSIRLGSNLLLTRLLFPEAFGTMAIVQAVMIGLAMLTDAGIEPAVIKSRRGHESIFLNTAWTLQVMQGVLVWLVVCGISPVVASFYAQPILADLLPVVGVSAILGGLTSTKFFSAARTLSIKVRVFIEVGSYAFGVSVIILLAWIDGTIWSLVWGGLAGSLLKVLASHLLQDGCKNKFVWDWPSVKELFGFGQWVMLSSALTFVAGEGSKLILGAFLGVKLLAMFTLASIMSLVFWQIAQQLSSRVFFPAYSEVARERPERLRAVAVRSRLFLIVPGWLIALFFVLWGDHFMWFLYDQRYAESGAILQLLAMGTLVGVVNSSYNGLLWARGLVNVSTVLLVVQVILQVVGMSVGNHYLGAKGAILGLALSGWLLYPVQAYAHWRIGLWMPKIDLPFLILSSAVVGVMFSEILNNV